MLAVLRVKNFILMDELELTLEPGLNVLTGETGAGKSIVVGALALVLGGRASADQIRPGADEAEVEALFDLRESADGPRAQQRASMLARLRDAGVLPAARSGGSDAARDAGSAEVAIRRVVTANGRSRAYVNGKLVTAGELAALAPGLADVASQHESVALTDPSTHLGYLDRFATLDAQRDELAERVGELEAIVERIRSLRAVDRSRAEREAFLRFQLERITEVGPRPGELEDLAIERKRLRNAGKLGELVQRAASRLEGEEGVSDQLARVAADLAAAAELDPSLESLARSVLAARGEIDDVAATASRYAESVEGDPARLGEIEERLYRLEQLLRQHGPALDDLLAAQARLEAELGELERAESRLAEEEASLEARLPAVAALARRLSERRREAAAALGTAIGGELAALGMGGARVLVEVDTVEARDQTVALAIDGVRLGRDGIDRVEFLISPNKGIDPKPLRKIASGGELSRALLALKRVLAGNGPAGLYVFDEVDTGVGGAVAEAIGRAIADVALHDQVLCITHLAPIASFAQAHFVVKKSAEGDVTRSLVERLGEQGCTDEIARMLSGAKVSAASREAAREMIADARASMSERRKAGKVASRAPRSSAPDAAKPLKAKGAKPAPARR